MTLPSRKAVIRLATAAESAATPAPHIDPPRLVGNTGEPAEFVLPTSNPNAKPGSVMDDFNYDAIAGRSPRTRAPACSSPACWSAACRRRASCSL